MPVCTEYERARTLSPGYATGSDPVGTALVSVDAGSPPATAQCVTKKALAMSYRRGHNGHYGHRLLAERRSLQTRHRAATTILFRGPFWLYSKLLWCSSTPRNIFPGSALKEDDGPPGGTLPTLQKPLCASFKIVSLDISHAASEQDSVPQHERMFPERPVSDG